MTTAPWPRRLASECTWIFTMFVLQLLGLAVFGADASWPIVYGVIAGSVCGLVRAIVRGEP